jgi:hypothetical protein
MNLKQRFKPRAEAGLLSRLVQEAWADYQDRIAPPERQAEVAEVIARHFEQAIPPADMEVLTRYNCVAWHDRCNVRVYDAEGEDVARYREGFGVQLPRKVPVVGTGGYGYLSLAACEPEWGTKTPLRELDEYFLALLTARKQYQCEYKVSTEWPAQYGKEHAGLYPTWGEIAERFPVLGEWIAKQASGVAA